MCVSILTSFSFFGGGLFSNKSKATPPTQLSPYHICTKATGEISACLLLLWGRNLALFRFEVVKPSIAFFFCVRKSPIGGVNLFRRLESFEVVIIAFCALLHRRPCEYCRNRGVEIGADCIGVDCFVSMAGCSAEKMQ